MTLFAKLTLAWGIVTMLVALFFIAVPVFSRKCTLAFPRSKVPAWIITFVNLLWVVMLVLDVQLGPKYDQFKPFLYIVAPILYMMIGILMEELLAVRSLGFLLMLLQYPLLDAGRFHESEWSFIMKIFSYLLVVAGIVLVLNPYMLRKYMAFWVKSEQSCRIFGLINMTLSALFLILALKIY